MHEDSARPVVRHWRASDRESLLRFANNRNVSQNLLDRFPYPYTAADADFWLGRTAGNPDSTDWAIEVEGMAVGGIGVRPAEGGPATTGHFGYWLGEPFWGRGIMTRAVRLVADHALQRLGYQRLEAPVFARNPASMRVLEKCGFRRGDGPKGATIKGGQVIDTVLYVRLATGNAA